MAKEMNKSEEDEEDIVSNIERLVEVGKEEDRKTVAVLLDKLEKKKEGLGGIAWDALMEKIKVFLKKTA